VVLNIFDKENLFKNTKTVVGVAQPPTNPSKIDHLKEKSF
jgi:hypothetical protein